MYWKKLFIYLFVCFATEIAFNLLLIDEIADDGEFLLEKFLVFVQSILSY